MAKALSEHFKLSVIGFRSQKMHSNNQTYQVQAIPVVPVRGFSVLYFLYSFLITLINGNKIAYSRYLLGAYIAQLRSRSVFFEWHRDEWNDSRLNKLIVTRMIKSARVKGMVFITDALRKEFERAYPANKKPLLVLPDAAFAVAAVSKSKELTATDLINVGYVGSFQKGKGLELIAPLIGFMPDVYFHVVGGSEQECSALQTRFAASHNVTFYGSVPKEKADAFIAGFDVCLLPNQVSVRTGKKGDIGRFTSPLKMFEYMAHGKPIIASDLPVLHEVLSEDFAIFAKPDSVQDWISAINRVKNDKILREQLGRKAEQVFAARYTWEKRALMLKNFIEANV